MTTNNAAIKFFKKVVKSSPFLYYATLSPIIFTRNIRNIFLQNKDKKNYYSSIEKIKRTKRIVLDIEHGGLGDWLVYTTLPKALKEKYDIDFYLSRASISRLRNIDTFKICFEFNPYFKGISDDEEVFRYLPFSKRIKVSEFVFDILKQSIIDRIEEQFGLSNRGYPKIFYQPKILPEYQGKILVDKNYISGKKMGWIYKDETFQQEINKLKNIKDKDDVLYIDPTKQDLFKYADIIASCKHFITVLSGGAALAASLNKPFTTILPSNAFGPSVNQFVFKKSKSLYKR